MLYVKTWKAVSCQRMQHIRCENWHPPWQSLGQQVAFIAGHISLVLLLVQNGSLNNCLLQWLRLNVPKQYMHPSWKAKGAGKDSFLNAFSCSCAPYTCTASRRWCYAASLMYIALQWGGWGVKRSFCQHLGSWNSSAFLGVPCPWAC